MKQNVYQISCICQHTFFKDKEILRFQRISVKHFNVKNQLKSVFATIYNTHSIIHCKIQMICLITSKKLITVYVLPSRFSPIGYDISHEKTLPAHHDE